MKGLNVINIILIYMAPCYMVIHRLPFELQCWSTTHFEGIVELSALLLYLKRFGWLVGKPS